MRKMLVIWLLVPIIGISQVKNVVSTDRVFPKNGKTAEFEKALTMHAQKYHTGNWKWRVWSVESGPDAGGYMITEGPNSWDQNDARGEISAEHTADWEKNVEPLMEGREAHSFAEFNAELSTVQLTDYADKILITYMIAKPGKISSIIEMTKKMKAVWQAGNESVAVYRLVGSGEPTFIAVNRLKEGFKELAEGFRKPMNERYDAVNGQGSFETFQKDYSDAVQKRWSELLIYKPGLSSK